MFEFLGKKSQEALEAEFLLDLAQKRNPELKYRYDNKTNEIHVQGDVTIDKGDMTLYNIEFHKGLKRDPNLALSIVHIDGNFDCSDCSLHTLKGGPKSVSGNYIARNNHLLRLDLQDVESIGGNLDVSHNKIYAVKTELPNVHGGIIVEGNPIASEIANHKFAFSHWVRTGQAPGEQRGR